MTAERLKVEVWIYRRQTASQGPVSEVLVLKMKPERGGGWQPVTGSVEPGEGVAQAALREAQEETGLPFTAAVDPLNRSFTFSARGNVYREHGFSLEAPASPTSDAIRLDPREHTEFRWVSPEEALKMMRFPENAAMLRLLLERIYEVKE